MPTPPYRLAEPAVAEPLAATYRCDSCDTTFAESALRRIEVNRRVALACPVCGHGVERLGSLGREVKPFAPLLLSAFAYPLRHPAALLAFAFASMVASILWPLSVIVRWAFCGYFFLIITKTQKGEDTPPEPADFTWIGDLIGPFFRFLLTAAFAFLPLTVAVLTAASLPVRYALASLGGVYLPAGLIVAAGSESFARPLNPLPALAIIAKIPLPYATLLVIISGALGIGWAIQEVCTWLEPLLWMIPLLPSFLASTLGLGLYAPFVIARMLGLLVREHAEDL
jgi:hypothetical protein